MNSLGINKKALLSGQISSLSLRLRENEIKAKVIINLFNVAKESFDKISLWLKELTNIKLQYQH